MDARVKPGHDRLLVTNEIWAETTHVLSNFLNTASN